VILDGFPRTKPQAEALRSILERKGLTIRKVVNLEVDDRTIIERLLKRGRKDDTEEVIANRLDVYRQETEPLLDFYGSNGLLVSVSGIGDVSDVNQRILDELQA
jgi:adenylate kinase